MTKNDLRAYILAKKDVEKIESELRELEARLYSPKSPNLDGMPKASGLTGMDDLIIKYLDLQRKYEGRLGEMLRKFEEIDDEINNLPTDERYIVRCRFVLGLTIRQTAEEANYSEAQVKRIQKRALMKLFRT
jgi:RNA polymerase sigma factor (sigma-70 family)